MDQAVDSTLEHGQTGAHHHVRVEKQLPARLQHPTRFGEHRVDAVLVQMLEHVERVRFIETLVFERKQADIAAREIDGRERLRCEVSTRIDPNELATARAVVEKKLAFAAADVEHAVVG